MSTEEWEQYPGKRIPRDQLTFATICGSWQQAHYWEGDPLPRTPGALHWLPRGADVARFMQVAEAVHEGDGLPSVVEVGCGTGLLSLLMAETGRAHVVGMDPDEKLLLGGDTKPYSHPNLQLIAGTSKASRELFRPNPPDVVVSSWMPHAENIDLSTDIAELQAKAIIYVHQSWSAEYYMNRFKPKRKYRRALKWNGPSRNDVFDWLAFVNSEVPQVYGYAPYRAYDFRYQRQNQVEVHLRRGLPDLHIHDDPSTDKYPWETTNLAALIDPNIYAALLQKPDKLMKLQKGLEKMMDTKY